MNPDRDFFKNSVCRTCKRSSGPPVKYCARCRVVSYCCKEHQVEDWKNHKTLCKVISNEHQYLEYNVTNREELQKYKEERGLLWQWKLGRKLTKAELQIFMFPRFCAICFKRDSIFDCPECRSESYCSKDHQRQHSKIHQMFCKDLKLCLDMECYFYHNKPLQALSIKKVAEGLVTIPPSLTFLNDVLESQVASSDFNYYNSCDEVLSGITILFALEKAAVLLNRKLPKPSLELHIVGATLLEYSLHWPLIIEVFFHWIKNLEEIHMTFIGPETLDFTEIFQNMEMQFCQECRDRNRLVIKKTDVFQCLYHEKLKDLEKPDAVVALNSGLHEFHQSDSDTWNESINSLVENAEVPLLITAYTPEEIEQDLQIIRDTAKVKVIYGPTQNPFSNVKPFQNWATERVPIYFINSFLAIVKKNNDL